MAGKPEHKSPKRERIGHGVTRVPEGKVTRVA